MTPTISSQHHWLLISSPGDGDIDGLSQVPPYQPVGHFPGGAANGGASTNILFEITCGENPVAGLVPQHIAKKNSGRYVTVIFSLGFFGGNFQPADGTIESNHVQTHTKISTNAIVYTILKIEDGLKDQGSTSFKLWYGCDVAYLPPLQTKEGLHCLSLVVLDVNGSALSHTTVISGSTLSNCNDDRVKESIQKCSLQYEGIEGHRVLALLDGKQPEILVSGYSTLDGRPCLLH
jgi:hypothetical protein